jgi:hypothetical protein
MRLAMKNETENVSLVLPAYFSFKKHSKLKMIDSFYENYFFKEHPFNNRGVQ